MLFKQLHTNKHTLTNTQKDAVALQLVNVLARLLVCFWFLVGFLSRFVCPSHTTQTREKDKARRGTPGEGQRKQAVLADTLGQSLPGTSTPMPRGPASAQTQTQTQTRGTDCARRRCSRFLSLPNLPRRSHAETRYTHSAAFSSLPTSLAIVGRPSVCRSVSQPVGLLQVKQLAATNYDKTVTTRVNDQLLRSPSSSPSSSRRS